MGLIVSEVYDALVEARAAPDSAKAAAGAVPPADNMATKEDIARLENTMATKEDIARLEKQIAVLRFGVFTIGPAILAFMVKLTFFP